MCEPGTGGIHRTYLLDDGSAKAPPVKKMLGPVAGGVVRLAPFPEDGRIGVAEGIETALSAQAIFGVPNMAALSADGLRRWRWPDGATHVTIFADAGLPGMQAAVTLADQLNLANIPSRILVAALGTLAMHFGLMPRQWSGQREMNGSRQADLQPNAHSGPPPA